MISRRLLRIKAMQILYAHFQTTDSSINKSEKELFYSIQKVYDLYFLILLLFTELVAIGYEKIEIGKNKHRPSYAELNPNLRFVQNKAIKQLAENDILKNYVATNKLSWANEPELLRRIYNIMVETEAYKNYMNSETNDYNADKQFLIDFITNDMELIEDIHGYLEELSIYWNDDYEFVLGMIVKTLGKFKQHHTYNAPLLNLFKNEADRDFVKNIFRKSILKNVELTELITKYSSNWDVERIAFMDIVILKMAVTEILECTDIPMNVTFNEYIELSKYYSTQKSSLFINGILDKIVNSLKNKGLLKEKVME